MPRPEHHGSGNFLAEAMVGNRKHDCLRNCRMSTQDFVDFARIDVLSVVADQMFLQATMKK